METLSNTFKRISGSVKGYMGYIMDELDIPDPVTKLSSRQRALIKKNWETLTSDTSANFCENLLLRFLDQYPHYGRYFDFVLKSNVVPSQTTALQKHARKVMNALASIIDNLHAPDALLSTLRSTARTHYQLGVREAEFEDLFGVLMVFLKEKLGEQLTAKAEEAWTFALCTVCSVISDEMTQLEKRKSMRNT